jgi:hypothetical protein
MGFVIPAYAGTYLEREWISQHASTLSAQGYGLTDYVLFISSAAVFNPSARRSTGSVSCNKFLKLEQLPLLWRGLGRGSLTQMPVVFFLEA